DWQDDFRPGTQVCGIQHPEIAFVMPHRRYVDENPVEPRLEETRAPRKLDVYAIEQQLQHHCLYFFLYRLGRGFLREKGNIEVIIVRYEVLLAAIAEQAAADEVRLVAETLLEVILQLRVCLQRAFFPFQVP